MCRNHQANCSKAVIWLQTHFPEAKVLYVTATAGTEPSHLTYMRRLGLWGKNAPFRNLQQFLDETKKSGFVGMELVANYLKSQGSFIARQLKVPDLKYVGHELKLTPEQQGTYDKSVILWQSLLTLVKLQCEKHNNSKDLRNYWGTHQRFFHSLILSFKASAVKELLSTYPADQYAYVIAIQSTGHEGFKKCPTKNYQEFSTCRQIAMNALDSFGVPAEKQPTKPEPLGNSIKDRINFCISHVHQMYFNVERELGPCAIEKILKDLGGHEKVAEVTGRKSMQQTRASNTEIPHGLEKRRLSESSSENDESSSENDECGSENDEGSSENDESGSENDGDSEQPSHDDKGDIKYSSASLNLDVNKEVDAFQNGEKFAIIISQKGSTGISLHSDQSRPNSLQRLHVVLQLPWVPEHAIQQLGRTNRSNQKFPPIYVLFHTDIPGELRFFQTVFEKLNKLLALCEGERGSSSDLSRSLENPLLQYPALANLAAKEVVVDIEESKNPEDEELQKQLKLVQLESQSDTNLSKKTKLPDCIDMQRFMNRILGLKLADQKKLLEKLIAKYESIVDRKIKNNELELGMKELTDKWTLKKRHEKNYGKENNLSSKIFFLEADKGTSFEQLETTIQQMSEKDRCKLQFFWKDELIACCFPCLVRQFTCGKDPIFRTYKVYTPWDCNFNEYQKERFHEFGKLNYLQEQSAIKEKWEYLYKIGETLGICRHNYRIPLIKGRPASCEKKNVCDRDLFGPRKFKLNVLTGCLLKTWRYVTDAFCETTKEVKQKPQILRLKITHNEKIEKHIGVEVPERMLRVVCYKLEKLYNMEDGNEEKAEKLHKDKKSAEKEKMSISHIQSKWDQENNHLKPEPENSNEFEDADVRECVVDELKMRILFSNRATSNKPVKSAKDFVEESVECAGSSNSTARSSFDSANLLDSYVKDDINVLETDLQLSSEESDIDDAEKESHNKRLKME